MVRSLLILISLCAATFARAEGDNIPDPRTWAAGLPDAIWTDTPGIVRTFTIVQLSKKPSKKWTRIAEKLTNFGFLQFFPVDASSFAANINIMDDAAAEKGSDVKVDNPGVHLILKEEKGSKLVPQHVTDGKLKSFGKWTITKPDTATSETFYNWLVKKMAYDAVVLDVKDGFILAGLLHAKADLGQGLLIKNSADKQVLSATKIKGDALLQMLRVEGEYAVFESLLSNSKAPIKPGTKILLGQSEQLKSMMAPSKKGKTAAPAAGEAPAEAAPAEEAPAAPAAEAAPPADAETSD